MKLFNRVLFWCISLIWLIQIHTGIKKPAGIEKHVFKLGHTTHYIRGGSAWAVQPNDGKPLIISNDHVCLDKGQIMVALNMSTEEQFRVKVIKKSLEYDLCIAEPIDYDLIEGIRLGEEPEVGQSIFSMGHPRLRGLVTSEGKVISKFPIDVISNQALSECTLPYNEIRTILAPWGAIKRCFVMRPGFQSTHFIAPGSSGSVVVDTLGQAVGIIFAMDQGDLPYSYFIGVDSIRTFLSDMQSQ